jgi:nucleoside-diphosphate-sugar epimerase
MNEDRRPARLYEPSRPHSDWHNRSVLVTGARGFIGSHLCQRLSGLGARVYRVSRAAVPIAGSHADWIRADFARASDAKHVLDRTRPDVVFHLAGHVTGSQDLAQVFGELEEGRA